MPNETVNTQQEVKKVAKRGIGTAKGTTRFKFNNSDVKPNGLFIGHLDSIECRMITIGAETSGLPSFSGLEIPKLVITFASNDAEPQKRKYVDLSFTAVESNAENIVGGKGEWKVNVIFDWMKHIIDTYIKRPLTEEEIIGLSLPFDDVNEAGEYEPIEVEEVIAGWKSVFENFVHIMTTGNEGKSVFKTKDGKDIAIWMKLIRYSKSKSEWKAVAGGELAFPTFVGEGAIEVFKQNIKPSIALNANRESIIIKQEEPVAKAPTNLPMGGGIPMMGDMVPTMDDLAMGGGDDPFGFQ